MSRREFFEFVVAGAKQRGAEKGREMGLASGYLQAQLESAQSRNATVHAQIQSLAQSLGLRYKRKSENDNTDHLQVARLVYNALTKGESPHFRVESDRFFDSYEDASDEAQMSSNVGLGLAAVTGVGKLVGGMSDAVTEGMEGLSHFS